MIALSLLLVALGAGDPAYRPPRAPRSPPAATAPDSTLSDAEVRSRVEAYLESIDVPVTYRQWQALGPRAVPLLEQVLQDPNEMPTRRAAAVGGLAAVGGARARRSVLAAARSEDEPFAVRMAALHGAGRLLGEKELVSTLGPVLQGSRHPAVRAAAADVLSRRASASACPLIRAEAERDPAARPRMARALDRCDEAP